MILTSHPLEQNWQPFLYRETYIAVLNFHLRQHGSKQAFARHLGITPVYLSYLLDPYNARTPNRAMAERIAAALDIAPVERRELVEMMLAAKDRSRRTGLPLPAAKSAAVDAPTVERLAWMVENTHVAAKFATHPQQAAYLDDWAQVAGRQFLSYINPALYPVSWSEVALVLVEIAHNRGHHARALLLAKRVGAILQATGALAGDPLNYRYEHHLINARRNQAVTLNHLHLYDQALRALDSLGEMPQVRGDPLFWQPHLVRDRLDALRGMRRVAVSEVVYLAEAGTDACGGYPDSLTCDLLALLIQQKLADFYLLRGRTTVAQRTLQPWIERMQRVSRVGPLYRLMTLTTYARLQWAQGDVEGWRATMVNALTLGSTAQLRHRCATLLRSYPTAIHTVLERLDEATLLGLGLAELESAELGSAEAG